MDNLRFYVTLTIGLFLMINLALYGWRQWVIISRKSWSFRSLLRGFRAKMWMTLGLGIFFFGLYGIVVWICSRLINSEVGEQLFKLALGAPHYFVYGGLLLFAMFSLGIYLVRMVIKYLYLTRGRGD